MRLVLVLVVMLGCGSPASTASQHAQAPAVRPTAAMAEPPPAPVTAKSHYSCFSYASKTSATKRHACSRADDCAGYLDQAKSVPGLKDFSGCETVASVFCFHQVGTKDDPDGEDICQPTLDECKTGRSDVVKAKMEVDSECAAR